MNKLLFLCSRLWRFNNLYFLKPNDAINDTLTASLLINFDWSGNIVEIGSGDGVFSYILHGGYFSLAYDRYSQVNLNKNDNLSKREKEVLDIFNSFHKANKHKMDPIPVCEIPKDYL